VESPRKNKNRLMATAISMLIFIVLMLVGTLPWDTLTADAHARSQQTEKTKEAPRTIHQPVEQASIFAKELYLYEMEIYQRKILFLQTLHASLIESETFGVYPQRLNKYYSWET
jgi:hypothetical protein